MADLDYTIGINTNQAERNVDRLKRNVSSLGETFGKLRNVIGGIAIGGLIANTVRWADAIQDVSDSTNIATANILGFSQAVAESGGTAEDANNAVLRLSQTIGEARQGNKAAIESFAKIGLSLDQIKKLSEQEILRKVIQNLGTVGDASQRAALQIDLLGKGMRGVQMDKVNLQYESYVESNEKSAVAVKSAADAQENLGKLFGIFRTELLTMLKPISDFIADIDAASEKTQRWAKAILYAAAAVAAILAAFSPWGRAIGTFIVSIAAIIRNFGALWTRIREVEGGIKTLVRGGAPLVKWLKDVRNQWKVIPDLKWKESVVFREIRELAKLFQNLSKAAAEAMPKIKALLAVFVAGSIGYFSKELSSLTDKFKELIGLKSKAEAGPEQKYRQVFFDQGGPPTGRRVPKEVLDQIRAEREAREKAASELANAQRKEAFRTMNEMLGDLAVQAAQLEMDKERQREAERLRNLFADIALINQEIATKTGLQQLAAQNELIGLYGREYELKAELLAIDAERQNAINGIIANLKSMGQEATAEDVWRAQQEIQLAQYVADERLKIFRERVAKEKAIEGSALEGVKASLAELAASVTPFNVAQQTTRTLFDGMMNGLEQFATTGKLKFKDFALSLIRDLLLIQLRAQATQMFAGIGNFFTAMFAGRAAGGPVKGNTPYVVGEKGPELFVPKSAGTIIPNDKMSSGQAAGGPVTNVYNNYNISAIDSQSVAQFFAQNRKMALGAVEMARKELPYGAG